MHEVKKIIVIGPESTGKSTLCRQLATHYNTIWCPEYAREYLLKNGTQYSFHDLLNIAKGQIELEDAHLQKVRDDYLDAAGNSLGSNSEHLTLKQPGEAELPMLFIDTDMYVMKVWCEFVFNKCHQYIIDKIVERPAHLYLLCNVDLPWTKDELREYPDLETREELYHIYRDILINQPVPWAMVQGSYEQRTSMAIDAVNNYFFAGGRA